MIGRLNHVGVATPSIDKSIEMYRNTLGATDIGEKFKLEEQGVWVCFITVAWIRCPKISRSSWALYPQSASGSA